MVYLLRMPIDDMPVKGRGASEQVPNRFEQRSYQRMHVEGLDEVESETLPTSRIEVFPRTIINRVDSPDLPFSWSMNPYQGCEHGCSYCYARPTHEYWGYSAGLDFERVVLVKRNAPELFEQALRHKRWKGEPISLSGATDPYQPVERTERLTRRILEIALAFKQPLMLITKNALIERDIDLLTQLAEQRLVQVAVSLTTLNEELRRKLEPRTSTGPQRLEVIENLSKAHIPVLAMIAPVIPALNEPEVPELLRRASLSGALGAGYTVLRLNGPVRPVFERWLRHHYQDRAEKVLAQTRALHGGDANDSVHGRRMKGEGAFATNIQRLFQVMHARYFSQKVVPVLKSSLFSPPPKGQLDLFQ